MRPLSDIATTLFLAIAVRYVTNEPTLADAAAILSLIHISEPTRPY